MIFGLQTKALLVVGVICGVLLAGLGTMTWLYGNAKTELGYQNAENDYLAALNEKNVENIHRLKAEAKKSDRAAQWLSKELREAEHRAVKRDEATRELERTNESYANYRAADMHAVTDRRLRQDAHCARNRVSSLQGAEPPDPDCTTADKSGE